MNRGTAHLLDKISSAVYAHPHLARRNLQLERSGRRVTLRGTVESYYQKQLVQETLRRIDGVDEIENRIAVCWPADAGSGLAQSV